jgi:hypothetical protein
MSHLIPLCPSSCLSGLSGIVIPPANEVAMISFNPAATSNAVSNSVQVKLPLTAAGTYDFVVDWGDNSNSHITTWNEANATHTYSNSAIRTLTLTGKVNGFSFSAGGDRSKIKEVMNWGAIELGAGDEHFRNCDIMTVLTNTGPSFANTTSAFGMFRGSISIDINTFEGWQGFGTITNTARMFNGTSQRDLSQTLNTLDMSNVTNAAFMFASSPIASTSLKDWDVGALVNAASMFVSTTQFNTALEWDGPNVTDCSAMMATGLYNTTLEASTFNSCVTIYTMMMAGGVTTNTHIAGTTFPNVVNTRSCWFNSIGYNRSIADWNFTSIGTMQSIFLGTSIDNANYSASLIAADAHNTLEDSVPWTLTPAKYTAGAAANARAALIADHSWSITDNGAA